MRLSRRCSFRPRGLLAPGLALGLACRVTQTTCSDPRYARRRAFGLVLALTLRLVMRVLRWLALRLTLGLVRWVVLRRALRLVRELALRLVMRPA